MMRHSAELAILAAVAAVGIGGTVLILWRARRDPNERERRRRLAIDRLGRMGDAIVTDVSGDTVYYSYTFRGVEYATSQDVSALRDLLPENLETLIGPVTIKVLPDNPCNSILACETWTGMRVRAPRVLLKGA